MALLFTDNAATTLFATISAVDTTLTVVPATGNNFPITDGADSDYFVLTLEDTSGNIEFIRVDHRLDGADQMGNGTYPCTRGYYGSTARIWQAGDIVDLRWNAGVVNQFVQDTELAVTTSNGNATAAAEWANNAEDVLVSAAAGGDEFDDYSALHHAAKAAASASAASGSAGTATTQAGTATTQAGLAAEWAEQVEDTEITGNPGQYSALHHAAKASASAGAASGSAGTATTQAGTATTQAGLATTQAGLASDSADLAEEWATKVEDVAITGNPGQYSALHWAAKAEASAASIGDPVLRADGATGSATIPAGTTAQRGTPANGAFRYNSDTPGFEGLVDGTWGPIAGGDAATMQKDQQTATAGQTVFSGLTTFNTNTVFVYLNGVKLLPADYTINSDTQITLTEAAALDDVLEIQWFDTVSITDAMAKVTPATQNNLMAMDSLGNAIDSGVSANFVNENNLIVNGGFQVDQRNQGPYTATAYGPDRWRTGQNGAAAISFDQVVLQEDVNGVFTDKCYELTVNGNYTHTGTNYLQVRQNMEGAVLRGVGFGQTQSNYVTLSFSHKHSKTGTFSVAFTSSGYDRTYIADYTQSVADVWEKETITLPVDSTTSTWSLSIGALGLQIAFSFSQGDTYQTATTDSWFTSGGSYFSGSTSTNSTLSTGDKFRLANVKLEPGSTASPYVEPSFASELLRCQRYFQKSYSYNTPTGTATVGGALSWRAPNSSVTIAVPGRFVCEMAAVPTVTGYSVNNGAANTIYNSSSGSNVTINGFASATTTGWSYFTTASTISASQFIYIQYTAEAEI